MACFFFLRRRLSGHLWSRVNCLRNNTQSWLLPVHRLQCILWHGQLLFAPCGTQSPVCWLWSSFAIPHWVPESTSSQSVWSQAAIEPGGHTLYAGCEKVGAEQWRFLNISMQNVQWFIFSRIAVDIFIKKVLKVLFIVTWLQLPSKGSLATVEWRVSVATSASPYGGMSTTMVHVDSPRQIIQAQLTVQCLSSFLFPKVLTFPITSHCIRISLQLCNPGIFAPPLGFQAYLRAENTFLESTISWSSV